MNDSGIGLLRIAIGFGIGLMFFGNPTPSQADEIELDAKVSRSKIQIADPIELEIRVLAPAGSKVSFPPTTETLGRFEVLSSDEKSDVPASDRDENRRLWMRSLALETFETGQLEIPAIEVIVKEPGQAEQILRTQPIAINVASVIEPAADLTKFKDIADVHDVEVPVSSSFHWAWIASSVAGLAIGFSGVVFFLTRRKNATASAKDWALRKLNDARELIEAETIVRQFVEEKFEFPATSLPAAQVLAELQTRDVDDSLLQNVQELLRTSERSKFGGLDLPDSEANRLLDLATRIVETLDEAGEQS